MQPRQPRRRIRALPRLALAFALAAAPLLGQATEPPQQLDATTFDAIWQHVLPKPSELSYRAIPWRAVLADAALEAHRADQPILLWAMNGHPLACT